MRELTASFGILFTSAHTAASVTSLHPERERRRRRGQPREEEEEEEEDWNSAILPFFLGWSDADGLCPERKPTPRSVKPTVLLALRSSSWWRWRETRYLEGLCSK